MITPDIIRARIVNYLQHTISGVDLVNCVDDAVSTDAVYAYDEKVRAVIMKYQDLLSLYVDDPVKRSESSAFYGSDKLRDIVAAFKQELDAVI